jgi:mannose-1-phosphate guanylyltransferase/mannose-6-phosphate isomerase
MQKNIVPVILSGGFGTRLWPISRQSTPKQFNKNILSPSLFQRANELVNNFASPIIVANKEHIFLIEDDISQNYDTIILEPSSRNTAPAILAAALLIKEKYGPETIMLVLPSDHLIPEKAKFIETVGNGMLEARDNIVTLGVKPTKAETGYGYIETQTSNNKVLNVLSFKEKPNTNTAESFIKKGNFYWNCGIFLINVEQYITLCKNIAYGIYKPVFNALQKSTIDGKKIFLSDDFANAENNSIDYAILEKTQNVRMVEMLSKWNDVGSFESLHYAVDKNKDNNVIKGNIHSINTKNCFIQNNTNHLLTTYGLDSITVIQTQDATLVAPIQYSQEIKKIVDTLPDQNKKIFSSTVHRPWGTYEVLDECKSFKVKKIVVHPNKSLSLQSHEHRSEHWVVVTGTATVINGEKTFQLTTGESTFIPKQTKHRLTNNTDQIVEIVEVQVGDYLGEDDIVRYHDDWNRK